MFYCICTIYNAMVKCFILDVDSSSEILQHSDDEGRLKAKEVILPNFPEVQIGSLYEKNPPVYYCARFLAYNFLLAGKKVTVVTGSYSTLHWTNAMW